MIHAQQKITGIQEIFVTPPTPPAAGVHPSMDSTIRSSCPSSVRIPMVRSPSSTPTPTPTPSPVPPLPRGAVVPYIRPTKFTPQLDYASSLDYARHVGGMDEVTMRSKWHPRDDQVSVTTWKRVSYDPPKHDFPEFDYGIPRRHSLAVVVDKKMQDLNQSFKDNINFMTQGLCYNKLDRRVATQLEPNTGGQDAVATTTAATTSSSVEANPLIYFKYDFGYEFGIADPKTVIRATSEPPSEIFPSLPSSSSTSTTTKPRPKSQSYVVGEGGVIHLPVIHEKSTK